MTWHRNLLRSPQHALRPPWESQETHHDSGQSRWSEALGLELSECLAKQRRFQENHRYIWLRTEICYLNWIIIIIALTDCFKESWNLRGRQKLWIRHKLFACYKLTSLTDTKSTSENMIQLTSSTKTMKGVSRFDGCQRLQLCNSADAPYNDWQLQPRVTFETQWNPGSHFTS